MSKTRRIIYFLTGLGMVAIASILFFVPNIGYKIVVGLIGGAIAIKGIKDIVYYFTMARHMVGGRKILFNGIIILEFGLMSLFFIDKPQGFVMLYLIVLYAIYGAIDILRGFEIKKQEGNGWVIRLIKGAVNIAIAVVCLVFIKSTELVVLFYGIGLLVFAVEKIISALKKSAIICIQ